jgi:uncharacterized protein (DUF4213/DUF364 family)
MNSESISDDYRRIGERLAALQGRPGISGLYLPTPVSDETFRDEFGFVFLKDGSVGPFYVSMEDILVRLWRHFPKPAQSKPDAMNLLRGFDGTDLAGRALALGVYNALSAWLYKATGFEPPDRGANSGLSDNPTGRKVGMVGYFCPLVEKLTAQGCEVLVLERAPERVTVAQHVSVTGDPRDLRDCAGVLCTASTLINDSLEEILATAGRENVIELIGPSGSGLPDPLLARGVNSIGGVSFGDRQQLMAHLQRGESWGAAGRKYQIDAASYPGLEGLLAKLTDGHTDTGES